MSAANINTVEQVTATVRGVDAKGNPAPIQGVPVWTLSDPTLVSSTPSADGLTDVFAALGPVGTETVTASAQNSQGQPITSPPAIITIGAAPAVALVVDFGTPSVQVPPTPPPPPAP